MNHWPLLIRRMLFPKEETYFTWLGQLAESGSLALIISLLYDFSILGCPSLRRRSNACSIAPFLRHIYIPAEIPCVFPNPELPRVKIKRAWDRWTTLSQDVKWPRILCHQVLTTSPWARQWRAEIPLIPLSVREVPKEGPKLPRMDHYVNHWHKCTRLERTRITCSLGPQPFRPNAQKSRRVNWITIRPQLKLRSWISPTWLKATKCPRKRELWKFIWKIVRISGLRASPIFEPNWTSSDENTPSNITYSTRIIIIFNRCHVVISNPIGCSAVLVFVQYH